MTTTMPKKPIQLILVLLLLFNAVHGWAQQSQDFGEYVVHFNAFNANLVPPEVAQQYDIQRSSTRALLNITVLSKVMQNPGAPVHAKVTATARNLSGQVRELDIREVTERGGAIYYLAQLRVRNEETFDFTVNVVPDGVESPYVVKFRQQFFTE